jgi:hypothetical protein
MLHELTVSSSGLDFQNSNYNYDYTNTNVSFHLCQNSNINPAHMAKNNNNLKSAGIFQKGRERDLLKTKGLA